MIEINAEKLAQAINQDFKDMRFHPAIESSGFAIFECNGIQVQILLTKDTSDFCDPVIQDIVTIKD